MNKLCGNKQGRAMPQENKRAARPALAHGRAPQAHGGPSGPDAGDFAPGGEGAPRDQTGADLASQAGPELEVALKKGSFGH